MRRRPIIVLLGVDGSGKTTQARQLAAWLDGQGVPARYFENAGGRPIWDALARLLGRADGRALFGCRAYVVVEASLRGVAVSRALALSWLTGRVAVRFLGPLCRSRSGPLPAQSMPPPRSPCESAPTVAASPSPT
ncbi:hypothetical protein [Parafrankia sp. FMc2]|uniref:hypothetical protein n=1 Tax=Parafrankia sp. FMc2 TaxID=3233196 RepID=UPI0034D6C9B1